MRKRLKYTTAASHGLIEAYRKSNALSPLEGAFIHEIYIKFSEAYIHETHEGNPEGGGCPGLLFLYTLSLLYTLYIPLLSIFSILYQRQFS